MLVIVLLAVAALVAAFFVTALWVCLPALVAIIGFFATLDSPAFNRSIGVSFVFWLVIGIVGQSLWGHITAT